MISRDSAKVTIRTYRVTKTGDEMKDVSEPTVSETELDFGGFLPTGDGESASVSATVSAKVAGHEYYGNGTWDRVPWEVFASATIQLPCGLSKGAVEEAYKVAKEIGIDSVHGAIGDTMASHITDIRERLFVGLFKNG